MHALKQDMKKIGRLQKRSDFLRVQKKGHKWVSKSIIVEICESEGQGLRCGLTVSKRVSKLAVTRNRVKRRLRAVSYGVLADYAPQNLDIVLIGRATTNDFDQKRMAADLRWCLKKMGVET